MARAKRTERAEARRRYRAVTASDPTAEDFDGDGEAPEPGAQRSTGSTAPRSGSTAAPARVGFIDAFKKSIRPMQLRPDLAAMPWMITHSKAIWLPVLITVASAIATAATGATDVLTGLLFTYFVVFPAIGGVFIGGFLAPRASYLVGIIIGLVSALCYVLLGVSGRLPSPFAEQFSLNTAGAAVSAFIYSPIMGAFFAAGAAWYRRFLILSSPNRTRRAAAAQKTRQGDGRTRGSNSSQKAGVKR